MINSNAGGGNSAAANSQKGMVTTYDNGYNKYDYGRDGKGNAHRHLHKLLDVWACTNLEMVCRNYQENDSLPLSEQI